MSLPHLGLRWRIVGALGLSAAVSLAVAALALLGPLDRRLRNREVESLAAAAQTAVPTLERLPNPDLIGAARGANTVVRGVARRVGGASVTLLDGRLGIVTSTDPGATDLFDDVAQALKANQVVTSTDRVDGSDDARVAVPLVINGNRYALALRRPLTEVGATARVVRRAFLVGAAAGLGVALLAGLAMASRLLGRLRRLRDTALRVAEAGPGSESVPPDRGRDEVSDLSQALATMQERLRQQEDARRAFVATASHELRTPVASLQGMLELLADDLQAPELDAADAREQVARAQAQARRLARLSADLLDLSRLDAEVPLRSEPVELGELSRAVAAEFAADGRIVLLPPDEPTWAQGDPGSVARIVRILLDNALRASPWDEPVVVSVGNGSDVAWLSVADHGPGVSPEEREAIFERFRRGSGAQGGGFGLGLAIGRGLAGRMGGSLDLEPSERGALFTVRLPADGA